MELFRGAKNFLLGSSSLGGALDVIVVRLPDGTLSSSPFHVRLERKEKPAAVPQQRWVRLRVNGVEVGLRMKLGAAGEAFFVEPSSCDPNLMPEKSSSSVSGAAATSASTSTAPAADGAAPWAASPLTSPGDATAARSGREGSGATAAASTSVAAATAEAAAAKLAGGTSCDASNAKADAAAALPITPGGAISATATTPASTAPVAASPAGSSAPAEAGDSWWWSWTWGGLPVRKDSASIDKKRRRRLSGGSSIDESDVRRLSSASEADSGSIALPATLGEANGTVASARDPKGSSSAAAEDKPTAPAVTEAAGAAAADSFDAALADGTGDAAAESGLLRAVDGTTGAQALNGQKTTTAEAVETNAVGIWSKGTGAKTAAAAPAIAVSPETGAGVSGTAAESGNQMESKAAGSDAVGLEAAILPGSRSLPVTAGNSTEAAAVLPVEGAASEEPAGGAPPRVAATAALEPTSAPAYCEAPGALPVGSELAASKQNGVARVAAAPAAVSDSSDADAVADSDSAARSGSLSVESQQPHPVALEEAGPRSDANSLRSATDNGRPIGADGANAVSEKAVDQAGAGLATMELISPQTSNDGDFLMPLSSDGCGSRSVGVNVGMGGSGGIGGSGSGGGGSGGGGGGDGAFKRVASDNGFNRNMSMDFASFHTPCGSSLDLPAIAAASEAHETTLAAALAAAAAARQTDDSSGGSGGSGRRLPAAVEAAPLPLLSLCGPLTLPGGEAVVAGSGNDGSSGGVLGEEATAVAGQNFMEHVVTLDQFLARPQLLENRRLVVCLGDSLLPFQDAIPALVALSAFGCCPPAGTLTAAAVPAPPAAAAASWAGSRGWSKQHPLPALAGLTAEAPVNGMLGGEGAAGLLVGSKAATEAGSVDVSAEDGSAAAATAAAAATRSSRRWLHWLPPLRGSSVDRVVSEGGSVGVAEDTLTEAVSSVTGSITGNGSGDAGSGGGTHVKTLRPTSAQLAALGLHEGANLVEFTLAGADGASVAVLANVFLWDSNARILVADLDGTVACGSDVPGLASFVPVAGPTVDKGLMKLLWGASDNGYKLVYLSSKPPTLPAKPYIKMAPVLAAAAAAATAAPAPVAGGSGRGATVTSGSTAGSGGGSGDAAAAGTAGTVTQPLPAKPPLPPPAARSLPAADGGLPVGPVLCTPEALLPGGGRIVSSSASAEARAFVTAALQGLAQLFPRDVNPLYAGLGTDSGEAEAFRRCGVPPGRALVCRGGELRGLNRTFRRSVESATSIIDEMFPPLPGAVSAQLISRNSGGSGSGGGSRERKTATEDAYADANFWREPPALITSDEEDN